MSETLDELICPICFGTPYLPVTLNNENGNKCPYSEKNPSCLSCTRNLMGSNRGKKSFKCLSDCCIIPNNGYKTYGENSRYPSSLADSDLWISFGKKKKELLNVKIVNKNVTQ